MMSSKTIEAWLNAVDELGKKLGWKDYKAYRAHCLNRISSEDREDIFDYLQNYDSEFCR